MFFSFRHSLRTHPASPSPPGGFVSGLFVAVILTGCQTPPAPDSGFIVEPARMTEREKLPFQRAWRSEEHGLADYRKVWIAPVATGFLLDGEGEPSRSGGAAVHELAADARQSFEEAFRTDPQRRFQVVDSEGPGVLKVEIAIIEAVPTKAAFNALTYAVGPTATAVGASTALGAGLGFGAGTTRMMTLGVTSIEGRVTDSVSGERLFLFADREKGRAAPINVKHFRKYAHARSNLKNWAKQLREVLKRPAGAETKDRIRFTLLPW